MSYHTLVVQRILLHFRLWHVYNPVYIERDLLGIRRPRRIAEAIGVLAITLSIERIIFVRNGIAEILAVSIGIFNLLNRESKKLVNSYRKTEPHATRNIPRNQSRDSRCLQTLGRRPGTRRSSCRLCGGFRGSIRANGL